LKDILSTIRDRVIAGDGRVSRSKRQGVMGVRLAARPIERSPSSSQAQVFGVDAVFLRVSREFEIRSGRRTVSMQRSSSALQAALDYVRSFGSVESEIMILGVDRVAWRGAQFTAVLVPEDPLPGV